MLLNLELFLLYYVVTPYPVKTLRNVDIFFPWHAVSLVRFIVQILFSLLWAVVPATGPLLKPVLRFLVSAPHKPHSGYAGT